jgi:hypothetical protein
MELNPGWIGSGYRGEKGIESEAPAKVERFAVRGNGNDAVIAGSEEVDQMAGFSGFGGEEEKSE